MMSPRSPHKVKKEAANATKSCVDGTQDRLTVSTHFTKPSLSLPSQPGLKYSSAAWEYANSTTNGLHKCRAYTPWNGKDQVLHKAETAGQFLPSITDHQGNRSSHGIWGSNMKFGWRGTALPLQPKVRQCNFSLQQAPSIASTQGF